MFESMNADVMLKMKKYGYLTFWSFMVPLVPFSAYVGVDSGTQDYWAWFVYAFIFCVIPVLDYLVGKVPTNPSEDGACPQHGCRDFLAGVCHRHLFCVYRVAVLRRPCFHDQ